jgi:hypothetical protein
MLDSSQRRQSVFLPLLFQVDQGALPLTEQQVLQGGNGQKL